MKKRRVILYAAAGFSLAAVSLYAGMSGYGKADTVMLLCDALTVPGIVLTGIGALGWIAYGGCFDVIGYAISGIGTLIRKGKKEERYYDYVMRKRAHRSVGYELLTVGTVFLTAAVIMLLVYLMR